jgi:hypothetical protein
MECLNQPHKPTKGNNMAACCGRLCLTKSSLVDVDITLPTNCSQVSANPCTGVSRHGLRSWHLGGSRSEPRGREHPHIRGTANDAHKMTWCCAQEPKDNSHPACHSKHPRALADLALTLSESHGVKDRWGPNLPPFDLLTLRPSLSPPTARQDVEAYLQQEFLRSHTSGEQSVEYGDFTAFVKGLGLVTSGDQIEQLRRAITVDANGKVCRGLLC